MQLIHALAFFAATATYALPQGLPIVGGLLGGAGGGDASSSSAPADASTSAMAHPTEGPKHEDHHRADMAASSSAVPSSSAAPESSQAPGLPIIGGILVRSAEDDSDASASSSAAPGLPKLPIVGDLLPREADNENHVTRTASADPASSSDAAGMPKLPIIGDLLPRAAENAAPTELEKASWTASVPAETASAPIAGNHFAHKHNDPAMRVEAPPAAEPSTTAAP